MNVKVLFVDYIQDKKAAYSGMLVDGYPNKRVVVYSHEILSNIRSMLNKHNATYFFFFI